MMGIALPKVTAPVEDEEKVTETPGPTEEVSEVTEEPQLFFDIDFGRKLVVHDKSPFAIFFCFSYRSL